ncbi:50S ribosomal protein L29 [Chryseobacterium salipaludis]|uniref:50S ribosomal protein L29 n=1 Tax=Chryseobacterium TaxID=59732 RepID=UPI001FF61D5E|nr:MULTISPECIES: 50S ribosomal protein L29 [Chryseobacterium]MCJ8498506.1 50S ribosomal protein L29 [Chryseobacterium salipaludis]MCX3297169.1 50S ribosomal protein L29 [Planobacterium sp. JC490]
MKKADIKNLSKEDLQAKLAEVKADYNKMVLAHRISPIENPIQIRDMRKNIARIQTELTLKQQ